MTDKELGDYIDAWVARMAKKIKTGNAIALKFDAYFSIVRHFLIEKGIVSAEEFNLALRNQLDFYETEAHKGIPNRSPIQKDDLQDS